MSGVNAVEASALIEVVRRVSAAEILPRFRALGAGEVDRKSSTEDLVTVADREAEAALSAAVSDILPAARIVGEEAVAGDRSLLRTIGNPGQTVIIDPVDGTWNFANGLAIYGVILAVVENGETVMGLLYDPTGDDWVVARRGEGAWYGRPGETPVRLQMAAAPTDLAETFGYVGMYIFDKERQRQIGRTLHRFRRTQSLRCTCHEYRMLAQGRAAFVLNGMLNPWDHAAGALALTEAGGTARLLDGRDYAPTMTEGILLNAAHGDLWETLAELWAGLVHGGGDQL